MANNRLLPQQFGRGLTLDGTRIQETRDALVALANAVPPELVACRWSPTHLVWGQLPPLGDDPLPGQLPWLSLINDPAFSGSPLQAPTSYVNKERVKSCAVAAVSIVTGDLLTWEVSFHTERPTVLAELTVFADDAGTPYLNPWLYENPAPTGETPGDPTHDVTVNVAVDDFYQAMDRKRLRQEAVMFDYDTSQFDFNTQVVGGIVDTMMPPYSPNGVNIGVFDGKAIRLAPYILIPEYARVRVQVTIPLYANPALVSWGDKPWQGNIWSMHAQLWEAIR